MAFSTCIACGITGMTCLEIFPYPIIFSVAWGSLTCALCSFLMMEFIQKMEPNCGIILHRIGCHDSAKAYEEYRAQRVTQRVTMSE